jgi:hypothetical protein
MPSPPTAINLRLVSPELLSRFPAGICNLSAQVAYESIGRARCLLEAAAARGFGHVPTEVLNNILEDLSIPPGSKPRLSKVSRIIDACKAQWGWSQVDVAKALMQILPGAKPPARGPAIPESTGRDYIWSDLPSIAAALEAHKMGCQSGPPEAAAPPSRVEAVLETLNSLEERSPPRPRYRTVDAKRASARFTDSPIAIPNPAPSDPNFPIPSIPGKTPRNIFSEAFRNSFLNTDSSIWSVSWFLAFGNNDPIGRTGSAFAVGTGQSRAKSVNTVCATQKFACGHTDRQHLRQSLLCDRLSNPTAEMDQALMAL